MNKLMVIIFLSWISLSWAANHYVDKDATSGGNNGTSWANAWQSFAAINWSSIEPGDIIYISDGIYNEQLFVQASGTADNHITIRNSYEAGHNGRVIIDIVDYSMDGIAIGTSGSDNPDYIYIKGLEVTRGSRGIHVRYACEVITIDSCILINNFGRGIRMAGMDVSGGTPVYALDGYCADSLTVKNSIIITPDNQEEETDCVYFQDAAHIYLYNNFFHCRNRSPVNNHSDVIQSNRTRGWRIIDNVLISDSNAQGMPLIIGCWDAEGDATVDSVIIYNNYMYGGGIWRTGAPWVAVGNTGWNSYYANHGNYPPTVIIHNTFVSHGPYVAGFHIEFPATMINNIIAQFGDGVGYGGPGGYWLSAFRTSPTTSVDSIRHNLLWTEWLDDMKVQGTISGNGNTGGCYSWDTWVNTYGGTGVSDDPLFVDQIGYVGDQGTLDGELQADSPAINAGEDIQAWVESMGLPWTDIDGNTRPSEADSVTIGAYNPPWLRTVADPVNNGLPNEFSLHQNYPNPFNPITTIKYQIPELSFVTLKVYDALGKEVATLVKKERQAGSYEVEFNANDFSSGIYFYRLQAGSFVETKKMILLR